MACSISLKDRTTKFAKPVTAMAKESEKPARLAALPCAPRSALTVPTAMTAAARTTALPSDSRRTDSQRSQLLRTYQFEMLIAILRSFSSEKWRWGRGAERVWGVVRRNYAAAVQQHQRGRERTCRL